MNFEVRSTRDFVSDSIIKNDPPAKPARKTLPASRQSSLGPDIQEVSGNLSTANDLSHGLKTSDIHGILLWLKNHSAKTENRLKFDRPSMNNFKCSLQQDSSSKDFDCKSIRSTLELRSCGLLLKDFSQKSDKIATSLQSEEPLNAVPKAYSCGPNGFPGNSIRQERKLKQLPTYRTSPTRFAWYSKDPSAFDRHSSDSENLLTESALSAGRTPQGSLHCAQESFLEQSGKVCVMTEKNNFLKDTYIGGDESERLAAEKDDETEEVRSY